MNYGVNCFCIRQFVVVGCSCDHKFTHCTALIRLQASITFPLHPALFLHSRGTGVMARGVGVDDTIDDESDRSKQASSSSLNSLSDMLPVSHRRCKALVLSSTCKVVHTRYKFLYYLPRGRGHSTARASAMSSHTQVFVLTQETLQSTNNH